jgi:putative endonuclease
VSAREGSGRRRARRFGLRAETFAALWLLAKGYRVLARRFVVRGGELDLVVIRGDTVAFVEVKAREDIGDALGAIHDAKRRRISRAARVWLTRNPWAAGSILRGDAVFVSRWRLPRHAVAAYTLILD